MMEIDFSTELPSRSRRLFHT